MAKLPKCAPNIRAQAINELLQADGGPDAIRKLAQAVVDTEGRDLGINTMVREAMKPDWKKALIQLRINGLLSSPKTHLVNAIGNSMIAMFAVPERALAAAFSKTFHNGEITMGEVNAQAFGMIQGVRDGIKMLTLGSKASDDPGVSDLYGMFRPQENTYTDHLVPELVGMDNGSAFGRGLAYAGKGLNVPTAMLGKADDFFKSIGYRMELNALAHRMATSEGLEGDEFVSRVGDILRDPPDTLKAEAFEVARYQTFTNDLGDLGRAGQSVINKSFALKFVFPFVRTPTNILKYTFQRTPLAALHPKFIADIRAGGARAATAEARLALGSMILMSAGSLALSGRITGHGSLDPNQQRIARQTGWQPYSVKIGDRYFAYNRLDPLGMILGLGADIAEMTGGMEVEDQEFIAVAAAMALSKNLASKTYMSGAFDLMAALDDGNFYSDLDKYVVKQSFTFAPFSSLLRNVRQGVDTVRRDHRAKEETAGNQLIMEFVNTFRNQIPGQSASLPARKDLWGEDINQSSELGFLYDLASPIASRLHNPKAIDKVILDNQIPVSWPQRQIQGVKLSPEEYAEYSEKAGRLAKEQLEKVVKTGSFKALSGGPDGMKSEIVKRVISQSRKAAAAQLMQTVPDLQDRVIKKKLDKAKSLMGTE